MSHSKRNTSLAFFTSYERSLLKATWGSKSSRLARNSFLSFGACMLCLNKATSPVACGIGGEMFCRECLLTNILAQTKEIERLEREDQARKKGEAELDAAKNDLSRQQDVADFEAAQVGLKNGHDGVVDQAASGTKRKLALDADEILKNAEEERLRSRKLRESGKDSAAIDTPSSFWIASKTPSVDPSLTDPNKRTKLQPLCPGSDIEKPHILSMKTVVTVEFAESKSQETGDIVRICPSCKKELGNSSKAVLTVPCGHVLCKSCVDKFMKPSEIDPHEAESGQKSGQISCFVCETRLDSKDEKSDSKKKKKLSKGLSPGLVSLAGGGTGFAGAGNALVEKSGVAFQC